MNNKIQNNKANPQPDWMHEQLLRGQTRGFRPEATPYLYDSLRNYQTLGVKV